MNGRLHTAIDPGYHSHPLLPGQVGTAELAPGSVTAAKLASEAWTAYTPTYTGVTVGNGTVYSKYTRIGRTVHVVWSLTFGNTSDITDFVRVTLPVTAASANMTGSLFGSDDSAGARRTGVALSSITDMVPIGYDGAHWATLVPWDWTTSDTITLSLTYEAAS